MARINIDDHVESQPEFRRLHSVTEEDISDPVANIGLGIRWLAHKYSQIPKSAERDVKNMLKNYHSWNEAGTQYAKKILDLY